MSFLSLRNIYKSFDGFQALRGIDLDVERGETVAIIGPSGCGKSTLLRSIALFDFIDEGSIHLDGQQVIVAKHEKDQVLSVDVNQYRAKVGMVFQHLHIWPHLKIMDNLTVGPSLIKARGKKETHQKAMALLGRMGIADKANQYPQALSGGELQRVAIARALMMDPKLLLLDEITSALDPELVGDVLDIVAELSKEGMTMLIVTHEMIFASEVADRIIFLDAGRLVESGDAKIIIRDPQTQRLKDFLHRITHHRTKEEGL